ncbi:LacI family DNA-binding transcriptional regulator [Curtobacterium flaccumfaciens]|nr:LacI family DNA-binding transcriptional regulator [Curtobacterium flaccumfaciens]
MATMQQVADRAGVSIATVSFVVNGTKYVTPGTTARVRTAMRELKFRGNVVARALASRRTRIIALLFPTTGNRFSPTTSQFFMSAAERASERGGTTSCSGPWTPPATTWTTSCRADSWTASS